MFALLAQAAGAVNAAGAADASAAPSPLGAVLPIIGIALVLYLLIIRPQQKTIKQHSAMIDSLRRGDKIVTAGGVIGTIHKIEADDVLVVEIAPEIRIRVVRDTISNVLTKTTVANDNAAGKKE